MRALLWGAPLLLAVSLAAESAQEAMRRGLREAADGRVEQGLSTLRQAAAADPGDLSILIALGLTAQENRRYDEARDALERAAQRNPRSETALYHLAMLYEKQRDLSRARDAWSRFLALSPSSDLSDVARRHLERLE